MEDRKRVRFDGSSASTLNAELSVRQLRCASRAYLQPVPAVSTLTSRTHTILLYTLSVIVAIVWGGGGCVDASLENLLLMIICENITIYLFPLVSQTGNSWELLVVCMCTYDRLLIKSFAVWQVKITFVKRIWIDGDVLCYTRYSFT
jgi:hypothetical protein